METVNVAFCFDKNLWQNFCVTISSLLTASKGKCVYHIYAVAAEDITETEKRYITDVVNRFDENSEITFVVSNCDFNECVSGTAGYFYRLQLIKQTTVDKIIYCDVDIVFNDSLLELYHLDMGNNLLCGVKDGMNIKRFWKKYLTRTDNNYVVERGEYINSGVLLMNLKLFREENLYPKFLKLRKIQLNQRDQDMLNYVAHHRIIYLPLKYNFTPKSVSHKYPVMVRQGFFTPDEVREAATFAPIWHFYSCNVWRSITKGADKWWKYAMAFDFYDALRAKFMKQVGLIQKIKFILMERKNGK